MRRAETPAAKQKHATYYWIIDAVQIAYTCVKQTPGKK